MTAPRASTPTSSGHAVDGRLDDSGGLTTVAHHGHLWMLLDGTPAHAVPGRLTHSPDGQLACHLCGRWFTHLGSHLRRHGWSSARYREAVGLELHVALCSEALSQQLAARQRRHWREPRVRARFAPGQSMARSGELARRAAAAHEQRDRAGRRSGPVRDLRARRLAEGRTTQTYRREARLAMIIKHAGATDLHDLLRTAYRDGATLVSLGKLTGLGRERLRAELLAAEVRIRPTGHNIGTNKHNRAIDIDTQVAARVGADDLGKWLRSRRGDGRTLASLAAQTGRSIPWVRSRLAGTTTTAPQRRRARDG